MEALGRHVLAEFYECDADAINDVRLVEETLINAAKEARATVIGSSFHVFEPHGVSGVVVISESHLAIHSWPEYAYAAVDIFTCGDDVDPMVAFEYLKRHFKTKNATYQVIQRGQLGLPTLSTRSPS